MRVVPPHPVVFAASYSVASVWSSFSRRVVFSGDFFRRIPFLCVYHFSSGQSGSFLQLLLLTQFPLLHST